MQGPLRSLLRWAHAAEDKLAKLPPEFVGPVHAAPARAVLTRRPLAAACYVLHLAWRPTVMTSGQSTKDSGVVAARSLLVAHVQDFWTLCGGGGLSAGQPTPCTNSQQPTMTANMHGHGRVTEQFNRSSCNSVRVSSHGCTWRLRNSRPRSHLRLRLNIAWTLQP